VISLTLRLVASIVGVVAITVIAHRVLPVNAATVGFTFLVLILLIASTWGLVESACASIVATLAFNFFFLPPVGTFTIADPQNWVALFSFLTTSLVASRLSTKAKQRARDAIDRQQDVERLYTFSRAILLIDATEAFPKQLALRLAEIWNAQAVVLFDRRSGEFFRAGPAEFDGLDEQLRDTALNGTLFSDAEKTRTITAVRLGSEPIASLALQGPPMPDSVLQGIANLVAIGLERARAQDLAHQVEAARQSEQLRTTLIDAMAHEFKTPLTSIKAATTSLLSAPEQPVETRLELLRIADEEAEHLRYLIDDAVEMARLDTANIQVEWERSSLPNVVREVVASMEKEIDGRPIDVLTDTEQPSILLDQRLIRLAIKQLLDNALKYSAPSTPLQIAVRSRDKETMMVDVTDHGPGILPAEQARVFERFWRGPSVRKQMPGSGLGLSIAHAIARAHNGDLSLMSRPGETTFRLMLPIQGETVERGSHSRR
jgi:two-component system sensor histidine kinase KdpD